MGEGFFGQLPNMYERTLRISVRRSGCRARRSLNFHLGRVGKRGDAAAVLLTDTFGYFLPRTNPKLSSRTLLKSDAGRAQLALRMVIKEMLAALVIEFYQFEPPMLSDLSRAKKTVAVRWHRRWRQCQRRCQSRHQSWRQFQHGRTPG